MTISDKKLGLDQNFDNRAESYRAQVKSAQDYYPFGWNMPGRQLVSANYRYGFNGKENDKEWGNQLIQDYGFRLYNPSIAKFLSIDPLTRMYPMLTPYQFASNCPIAGIDLDGLEFFLKTRGEGVIVVKAEIVLVNSSSLSKSQIRNLGLAIRNQMLETFDVYDPVNKIQYKGQLNFSIVEDVKQVPANAYYLELVNDTDLDMGVQGKAAGIGGTNATVGVTTGEITAIKLPSRIIEVPGQMPEIIEGELIEKFKIVPKSVTNVANTGVHELLHMMGLLHPWDRERTTKYGTFRQALDLYLTLKQAITDYKEGNLNSESITKLKSNIMNTDYIAIYLKERGYDAELRDHLTPEKNTKLTPGQLNQVHNNIAKKKVGQPRQEQENKSKG